MKVALIQLDPVIGDLSANTAAIIEAITAAAEASASLVVFPELAICGYPPRDLLFREGFLEACEAATAAVASQTQGITAIVGHPRRDGDHLRNSVSVCRDGEVAACYDKRLLPGYDVFDEDRYFTPGHDAVIIDVDDHRVGLLICEDLWQAGDVHHRTDYEGDPVQDLIDRSCDLLVCSSASPFEVGKQARHVRRLRDLARSHGVPVALASQVGANDDLLFDGLTCFFDARGLCTASATPFEQSSLLIDTTSTQEAPMPEVGPSAERFSALKEAVAGYVTKTRHDGVVLGISGGLDSALVATIATSALGPDRVTAMIMPSEFSSDHSREDAWELSRNLGLRRVMEIPIHQPHHAFRDALEGADCVIARTLADENVQARTRGTLVMAVANASNLLALATGNKSELAVGYATLYGDMAGAIAVIGDLLKTDAWDLARWINDHHGELGFAVPPIPQRTINKPPSAELRPDQIDEDSLPPYEVLDEIIRRFVEQERSAADIIADSGVDADTVQSITSMIDRTQFKREQAAVIPKLSRRAFGRGRVMPIVMRASSVK